MNKQDFFSFSLPFKLKCQVVDQGNVTISELNAVYSDGSCTFHNLVESDKGFSDVKPILRPLSELINEIEYRGEFFIPYKKLKEIPNSYQFEKTDLVLYTERYGAYETFYNMPFSVIIKLIEWKFDLLSLIYKGEAVDYSTLKDFSF